MTARVRFLLVAGVSLMLAGPVPRLYHKLGYAPDSHLRFRNPKLGVADPTLAPPGFEEFAWNWRVSRIRASGRSKPGEHSAGQWPDPVRLPTIGKSRSQGFPCHPETTAYSRNGSGMTAVVP